MTRVPAPKDHCSWTEIKELYLLLENEGTARQLLHHYYNRHSSDEKTIKHWAYANTLKFCYFIKQGVTFFDEGRQASIMVKPLLLFYGMTNLKKGLILLHDPHYPQTSIVLQHGLTTRKKKKATYRFCEDEVKIQREGLLPYFAQTVLGHRLTIHQKYKMKALLNWSADHREERDLPHEWLAQHMVLYCLSMLCRYDTQTWMEVMDPFASDERYLIEKFLNMVSRYYPLSILRHLSPALSAFKHHHSLLAEECNPY